MKKDDRLTQIEQWLASLPQEAKGIMRGVIKSLRLSCELHGAGRLPISFPVPWERFERNGVSHDDARDTLRRLWGLEIVAVNRMSGSMFPAFDLPVFTFDPFASTQEKLNVLDSLDAFITADYTLLVRLERALEKPKDPQSVNDDAEQRVKDLKFDDSSGKIIWGKGECPLPYKKIEHYIAKALFEHPLETKLNEDDLLKHFDINTESRGDRPPTRVYDATRRINERVKKGFELYASGTYSFRAVAKILQREGLTNNTHTQKPLTTSLIHKMLQNPFYFGYMSIKGQLHPHKYERIIDEWLYQKCQEVRKNWGKKPFKYAAKPFPLRGLIKCAYCGCTVSCDRKKDKYVYLSCSKYKGECGAIRVREEVVLEQIKDKFRKFAIPEDVLADMKDRLQASHDAKKAFHQNAIERLRKDYDSAQKQLDVLLDVRLQQSITQDEYAKKAYALKQRQIEIEVGLKEHTEADAKFAVTVSTLLDLAARASELFERSKADQKRQLINFALSNLTLRGTKLHFTLKKPFDAIVRAHERSDWLTGQDDYRTKIIAMNKHIWGKEQTPLAKVRQAV